MQSVTIIRIEEHVRIAASPSNGTTIGFRIGAENFIMADAVVTTIALIVSKIVQMNVILKLALI